MKVAAEVLKYGGEELRKRIYAVVKEMWRKAAGAVTGHEADEWPELGTRATLGHLFLIHVRAVGEVKSFHIRRMV